MSVSTTPTPWEDAAASVARTDTIAVVLRALVASVVLLIPVRILWLGWLPPDDVLRHAAKAVSGRAWTDVLVLRPEVAADSHPGWHVLLGAVHRLTGATAPTLVTVSVLGLALAVLLVPALLLRRPEAWVIALLVPALTDPSLLIRLESGRPYLLSAASVLLLCLLWPRRPEELGARGFLFVCALLTFVSWCHPTWYVFALLPLACFLARRNLLGAQFCAALGVGVVLAGALTGHPIDFVVQSLLHPFLAFGQAPARLLVAEFHPQIGPAALPLALVAVMGWRALRKRWTAGVLDNPIFYLALVGFVLGLAVRRFWADWGFPAVLAWLALEMEAAVADVGLVGARRLAITAAASLALWFAATGDHDGRWSGRDTSYECLAAPSARAALPDSGGILYSADMRVFYSLFYRLPEAPFRYVTGYEPGLMPSHDYAVYVAILEGRPDSYRPWIERMRAVDRLLVPSPNGADPGIPGLSWAPACGAFWSGRKGHD